MLSNAFKFTSRGKVSVEISVVDKNLNSIKDKMAEGKVIQFAVIDTGCGIPSEKQNIIFEAFRQADGSTNRKYGGTGLGLNISKELAMALGGNLEITESKKGQGSTFSLYLPERLLAVESDNQLLTEGEDVENSVPIIRPTIKVSETLNMRKSVVVVETPADKHISGYLNELSEIKIINLDNIDSVNSILADNNIIGILIDTRLCRTADFSHLAKLKKNCCREKSINYHGKYD